MVKLLKKHADKIKFAFIGGLNTTIDFGILFVLTSFGLNLVISNFLSTSVALIFSFFANKKYTFGETGGFNKKQFTAFLVVTLTGLWILQPIIISFLNSLFISNQFDKSISLLFSKLIATTVTLVWNYLLYQKLVFKKDTK